MTRMPMADPPGDRDPDLLQGVRSNILQLVPGQGGQHQQASDAGGGGSDQRRVDQRHNDLHACISSRLRATTGEDRLAF